MDACIEAAYMENERERKAHLLAKDMGHRTPQWLVGKCLDSDPVLRGQWAPRGWGDV